MSAEDRVENQKLGITMVYGHRPFGKHGKQVSVFEVGKRFRRGKLTNSR